MWCKKNKQPFGKKDIHVWLKISLFMLDIETSHIYLKNQKFFLFYFALFLIKHF